LWLLAHALAFVPPGLVVALRGPGTGWAGWLGEIPWLWTDRVLRPALALSALSLGLAQGYLLRAWLPGWGRAAIGGTALGAAIAIAAEWSIPDNPANIPAWWPELPFVWLVCLGAGTGLAQWSVLRRSVPGAGQWVTFSLISWTLCLPLGLLANGFLHGALGGFSTGRLGLLAGFFPIAPLTGAALGLSIGFFLRALPPARRPP
jgi:hypothetical protein